MDEIITKLAKRIKPHNGLVVNAEVWEEAHTYHHLHHQAHLLFEHGPGIITGLEIKQEGESSRLWVRPGMAIDPRGRLIIHDEPTSMLAGSTQPGIIYLYLQGEDDEIDDPVEEADFHQTPYYVKQHYKFSNGLSLPDDAIELGRIRLLDPKAPLNEPVHPAQPGPNEIDLRFRAEIGATPPKVAWLGIGYLGESTGEFLPKFGQRAGELAQAISHAIHHRICIDDDVIFEPGLLPYSLLYLIEQGPHELNAKTARALNTFLASDGTLLVESYHDNSPLLNHLASQEVALIDDLEPLLVAPFLFNGPPPGAREGEVLMGNGVIFSRRAYGRLWQRCDPTATREILRAATEWAANILTYAIKRQQQQQTK